MASRGHFSRMCRGPTACQHGWGKTLLPGCPPASSEALGDEILYRITTAVPPTTDDYLSHHELGSHLPAGVSECVWRGVSLWSTAEQCRSLTRTPKFKKRGLTNIVAVRLTPDSGAVQRKPTGHVSWWPCKAHDPIAPGGWEQVP